MAQVLWLECFDRSKRAALSKTRACYEYLRLVYEAEIAEYRRVLHAAHARITHAWKGKRTKLDYLKRRKAVIDVQGAWGRAVVRRAFQREIDVRVAVSRFFRDSTV